MSTQYGYWKQVIRVMAYPRQALGILMGMLRVCLGYAKGLPRVCLRYAYAMPLLLLLTVGTWEPAVCGDKLAQTAQEYIIL